MLERLPSESVCIPAANGNALKPKQYASDRTYAGRIMERKAEYDRSMRIFAVGRRAAEPAGIKFGRPTTS